MDRSGNDDHDAGHVRALVLETIIWVGSGGRHGEGSAHSRRGRGEEWSTHGRGADATDDLSSREVVEHEVAVEGDHGIGFYLDTPGNVILAVGAAESHTRRGHGREIHEHSRRAAIQGAEAGAAITHGACALRAVRAGRTIACEAGSTAINAGFRAILHAIGAAGRGAFHHRIAIHARAVAIGHAVLVVHAIGTRGSAAINVRFAAVLRVVRASWRGAHHHAIAIHAGAVAIGHAVLSVHAIRTRGSTAIDVRFVAVLRVVRASWRGAHHHAIAIRAGAIAISHAALPIHAIGHAGTAAIGIGFGAILEAVHAAWRCAHVRHWIAETAQTIAISSTDFPVGAIPARRPAAIDIRLHAVFLRVRTRGHRAHHGRTNLAQTIAAHHAHLAIGTSAARSAAIDVRFRAVFRHVAALCGLTNMVLTNVRHAISASVAFDARSRSVTNLAAAFHACKTHSFRRIREHAIGALILRTRLVVAHGVRIVIDRHGAAVSVTHHLLAIICRLSSRGRRIDCDVHLNTRTHHAIDRGTFASRRRAVIRGRTDRTATHSAHSTAHAAGTATCSAHAAGAAACSAHAAGTTTCSAHAGHSAAARRRRR